MIDSNKKDNRGYTAADRKKVEDFVTLFMEFPDDFPEFKNMIFNPDDLLDPNTKKPYPKGEDKLRRAVELYVFGRRDIDLGESKWFQDETAIVGKWPKISWKCRRCTGHVYVWFSHPSLDEVWDHVQECAKIAGTLAIIESIWASPAAGLALFKEQFYICLAAKGIDWASQIDCGTYSERVCGDWHGCG